MRARGRTFCDFNIPSIRILVDSTNFLDTQYIQFEWMNIFKKIRSCQSFKRHI